MNVDEQNEEVSAKITPGVIAEYLEAKPDDIPETMTVAEAIVRLNEWSNDRIKNREHTIETDVYADIDIEVDIDYDDVTDYLDDASILETNKVKRYLKGYEDDVNDNGPRTLVDEMKLKICEKAMEKYTLDQLERRLGMDWT